MTSEKGIVIIGDRIHPRHQALSSVAMRRTVAAILSFVFSSCMVLHSQTIDRHALVTRNNPVVTSIDTMASLSVGNGRFAFTIDFTGLQSFPEQYKNGVPLGTQSQWGWHSFPNTEGYSHDETLREYDFGHGHRELYSTQIKDDERGKGACNYFRANPHRLHLGNLGLDFGTEDFSDFSFIHSTLDLWNGIIDSRFSYKDMPCHVQTVCRPDADIIASRIVSAAHTPVCIRLSYPTGRHTDDGCDREAGDRHTSEIVFITDTTAIIRHTLDSTTYHIAVGWSGKGMLQERERHKFVLTYDTDTLDICCLFAADMPDETDLQCDFPTAAGLSSQYWNSFWQDGAAVDFSRCTDPRAKELERRVVLSQYLLAVQCAGDMPPQETGLTYNSWFGKFHLEMIWWHQAQFALWNRPQLLARSLAWYTSAEPMARRIARRQGFDGIRWMKMTDPSSVEAPSSVGSFLIWQQPHIIYLAELLHRSGYGDDTAFAGLVDETARFMCSFATRDSIGRRYVLKGIIPAQETLKAAETVNPPLELSYWHYGLTTAQLWRERRGLPRVEEWDEVIGGLSPLACLYTPDSIPVYLAAESAPYRSSADVDMRAVSDHPAVLGALGMLPDNPLTDKTVMRNTLNWIWDNWNWDKTWGWDYPLAAMCAARTGERHKAVDALLMDKRTNTYLPDGHNCQDERLRVYLPGNGGLLTAVAMMCAGWDGCDTRNPGFPDDGSWDVRWEGLLPMP